MHYTKTQWNHIRGMNLQKNNFSLDAIYFDYPSLFQHKSKIVGKNEMNRKEGFPLNFSLFSSTSLKRRNIRTRNSKNSNVSDQRTPISFSPRSRPRKFPFSLLSISGNAFLPRKREREREKNNSATEGDLWNFWKSTRNRRGLWSTFDNGRLLMAVRGWVENCNTSSGFMARVAAPSELTVWQGNETSSNSISWNNRAPTSRWWVWDEGTNARSIFETEIYARVYNDGFVYAHDCV